MSIAIKRNFTIPSTSSIGASEISLSSSTASTSVATGAIISLGGAGISGAISLGGPLKLYNGNFYTAFDSAATANTTYIWPATSPSTGTSVLSSDAAGNLSWILMSASGSGFTLNNLTATTQYFSSSISGVGFTISSIGSTHTFNIGLAGYASTGLISSTSQSLFGIKTFASGVAITSGTASTSTNTGDLTITGGVGIGGSLWTSTTNFSSISGVGISNSVITSGVWSGTAISAVNGGTGLITYTTGDILYATSSSSLGRITAGSAGSVLTSAGAGSTPYYAAPAATGITNLNGLNSSTQYFSTSISGSGFTVGSTGSTHTFYVALAGNASTGLISSASQTLFGLKTFASGVAITSGTASTSISSGDLVVSGGVGIGGSLYVQTLTVGSGVTGLIIQKMVGANYAAMYSTGVTPSGTNYTFITDGQSPNFNGTFGVYFNISNSNKVQITNTNINITPTTASTSTSTGSLTVVGGVGIGGSLWTATTNFSSISGVGHSNSVITSGVWAGTAISAVNGGTGLTSYTTGDILYASSSTAISKLIAGTAGSILTSSGAGSIPYWAAPAATGVTSLAASTGISVNTSTGAVTVTNTGVIALTGTANQVLVNGGSGAATSGNITLTTPQSIGTASSPSFADVTLTTGSNSTLATVGSAPTSIVNKQYVDNLASGLDIHGSVRLIQTSSIGASYIQTQSAGSASTGSYLISATQVALPAIDGVTISATGITQRVLVNGGFTGNATIGGTTPFTPSNSNIANGIYYVGALGGSGTSNWILVRATDTDDNTELTGGTFTFVEEGTTYADSGWVCSNDTTNLGAIQFGNTAITFTQFTGGGALSIGQGLNKVGNAIASKINISSVGTASGSGYTHFNLGGTSGGGTADTGYYPTFGVRTSGNIAGSAILTLNSDGFSLFGSTNLNRTITVTGSDITLTGGGNTLTLTGSISLPAPTANGIAYGSSSSVVSFLTASGSGASILTQTSGSAPSYLSQSQLVVGGATTSARWQTSRTVTFSGGGVTGSFSIDGSADVSSISLNIGNDAVALGTKTTGQYASTIAISGSGITATSAAADDGTSYTIYSSAVSTNTASSIVFRDSSGNFSAGTITGTLSGTATSAQVLNTTADNSSTLYILGTRSNGGFAGTAIYVNTGISALGNTITATTFSGTATSAINAGFAGAATTALTAGSAGTAVNAGFAGAATTAVNSGLAGLASNLSSGTQGALHYQSATNTSGFISYPGAGYALTSVGSGTSAVWQTLSTMNVGSATTATNAGFAGAATTAISAGSAGTSINAGFAGAATTATSAGSAGTAINAGLSGLATNLAGGSPGGLHYQSATNTSGFISYPGAGYALTSVGAGTSSVWQLLTAMTVGFAGSATTATNAGFAGAATTATSAGLAGTAVNAGFAGAATTAINAGFAGSSTNTSAINVVLDTSSTIYLSGSRSNATIGSTTLYILSGVSALGNTINATTFSGSLSGIAAIASSSVLSATTTDTSSTLYLIGTRSNGGFAGTALYVDTGISALGNTITATTFSGTASTSTNSANTNIVLDTTSTIYLTGSRSNASIGSTPVYVLSGVSALGNTITATTFSGSLSGTASIASSSVLLATTTDTSSTLYLIGTRSNGGFAGTVLYVDTGISALGNTITATTFSGTATTSSNTAAINVVLDTTSTIYLSGSRSNASIGSTALYILSGVSALGNTISATTFSGTATTATNTANTNVVLDTISTIYLTGSRSNASIGSTPVYVLSGVSALGNTVTATTFTGSLSGTASSAALVNVAASTGTKYLAGFSLNTATGSTQLFTGSGITIGDNRLTAGGLAVTSGTASTNTFTGALTVAGGVGITGQLSVNTIALGTTGFSGTPTMIYTGTAGTVISMSVLSDTTLTWEGSSGQLFSIDNNLSSGEIFSVSDISGLPVITASAGQTITLNEFGGYTQVGNGLASTSTTTGALRVIGGVGITGAVYVAGNTNITSSSASASTSTGALVVTGGVGVGASVNIGGNTVISSTTGSATTSTGALVVSGGVGIGASVNVAGNVIISSITASTSTTTGALVVTGGAGIGGTLNIGGNIRAGTNTFSKAGLAAGDILLDNGSTDTPGLLFYWGNNRNIGMDTYYPGTGSTRFRIVKELNESGGAELWSIDRNGIIIRAAWDAGEVIASRMYDYTEINQSATTTVGVTSYVRVANLTYTPKSSNSYIWIEYNCNYSIAGTAADDFYANITVNGTEIVYSRQIWNNGSGGGTRSGVLFPISARYTNSSTAGIAITVQARRNSSDDDLTISAASNSGFMRIMEIGR